MTCSVLPLCIDPLLQATTLELIGSPKGEGYSHIQCWSVLSGCCPEKSSSIEVYNADKGGRQDRHFSILIVARYIYVVSSFCSLN